MIDAGWVGGEQGVEEEVDRGGRRSRAWKAKVRQEMRIEKRKVWKRESVQRNHKKVGGGSGGRARGDDRGGEPRKEGRKVGIVKHG